MTLFLLLRSVLIAFLLCLNVPLLAEDGYRLWLRYDRIEDAAQLKAYSSVITSILAEKESPTLLVAQNELNLALQGLLNIKPAIEKTLKQSGSIVIGTPGNSALISSLKLSEKLKSLGDEGFILYLQSSREKNASSLPQTKTLAFCTEHFIL